jgi:hypothetical protein
MHDLVDVFGSGGHRVLTFGAELKSGVFGAIDPVVAEVDLRTDSHMGPIQDNIPGIF